MAVDRTDEIIPEDEEGWAAEYNPSDVTMVLAIMMCGMRANILK